MENLYMLSLRRINDNKYDFKRYLYKEINWDNQLIIIKGAKGVGKTTLLLQHIKDTFSEAPQQALYVSLDHVWFTTHSLLDLAEYHYTHGGTHLFLDEVHKYPNWEQEVKNIYDYYPSLFVIATGSSMLKIEESVKGDLSRRHRMYELKGLSFREFVEMETGNDIGCFSLENILTNHYAIAGEITHNLRILPLFEKYLEHGFYPFYKQSGDGFNQRLQQTIVAIIETEIPSVSKIEYESTYKIKKLLQILSEHIPYTLNMDTLTKVLQVSRNTLVKLLNLLERAALIRKLYQTHKGINQLLKPEKILFENPNLMYGLSINANIGTIRETFFASQLSQGHVISMPNDGDLIVDGRYTFEIGGSGKGFAQIRSIPNSYVAADGIEIGIGNKIPLWLFGCLY